MLTAESGLIAELRDAVRPLDAGPSEYAPALDVIGDARIVLLGEATHGTHEFYRARAEITQRLIAEKGFDAVTIEGDWPDAYRVNRFVRNEGTDRTAADALGGFKRFPQWMWRNHDVLKFVNWLREHNEKLPVQRRAGFYGLDLYSLHASMAAVLAYLDKTDPEAAARARHRYACLEQYGPEPQHYGYAASLDLSRSCENEAVSQLLELRLQAGDYLRNDGRAATDTYFFAEQNARLVKNAEHYYRTMFRGHVESWNLRDRHMAETLDELDYYLRRPGRPSRIVVWEHNSHLGDARATQMGERGELNLGQLTRERYGHETVSIGFSTFGGTVTAASEWEGPAERKRVRPALPESYESLFHETGMARFLLDLHQAKKNFSGLCHPRLQRAIGVIYRPHTERLSHYFTANLPKQFDAIIHFDETHAVHPLEPTPLWDITEPPETYPSGI